MIEDDYEQASSKSVRIGAGNILLSPGYVKETLSMAHAIECGPPDDACAPKDAGRFDDQGFPPALRVNGY